MKHHEAFIVGDALLVLLAKLGIVNANLDYINAGHLKAYIQRMINARKYIGR